MKEQSYIENKLETSIKIYDHSVYEVVVGQQEGKSVKKRVVARSVAHLTESLLKEEKIDSIYIKSIKHIETISDLYILAPNTRVMEEVKRNQGNYIKPAKE